MVPSAAPQKKAGHGWRPQENTEETQGRPQGNTGETQGRPQRNTGETQGNAGEATGEHRGNTAEGAIEWGAGSTAMTILLLIFGLVGSFGGQRPSDIVKWSAEPPEKSVAAGGLARIALTAKVEDGWKLYSLAQPKGGPIPLEIAIAKDAPFTLSAKQIESPAAKVQKDELFAGGHTQYYEKEAAFVLPVAVPKTLAPGSHTVPIEVTFQACGKEICLRPFTQRLEVNVSVVK